MFWKNPNKELPQEGCIVAVLIQHNKKHFPLSLEIAFGEVQYFSDSVIVSNDDFIGAGSMKWILRAEDTPFDRAIAWAYFQDLDLPGWIVNDSSKLI